MSQIVPLPLIYSTLFISIIGVFGNLTIVSITLKNKSLHSRCCLLIGILAFFDFIVCVYLVQLRILMILEIYFIPNSSCFYLSAYGIFAMNMQSALGLFIGIDRLLNVSFPIKYPRIPACFYATMLLLCLIVSTGVTVFGWFLITDDRIRGVCLPVTALTGYSLSAWLFVNFSIACSVVLVYGWAYIRCQFLRAKNQYTRTMGAADRILKSLTIIISLYVCTWFLAMCSLFISDVLDFSPQLTATVQQWAGWFVVCNSSLHVFVYFWRTAEYRKAICRFYGFSSESESNSRVPQLKSAVML